jgi:hypothetical protein
MHQRDFAASPFLFHLLHAGGIVHGTLPGDELLDVQLAREKSRAA